MEIFLSVSLCGSSSIIANWCSTRASAELGIFRTGLIISILSSMVWIILNRLVYLPKHTNRVLTLRAVHAVRRLGVFTRSVPDCDRACPGTACPSQSVPAAILFQFIVSAMQLRGIREGYQFKILIMRFGHTPVGRFLFNATTTIPFLFEIHTLLDWLVCDTSLVFSCVSIRDVVLLASQDGHVALVEKEQTRLLRNARPVPWFMKAPWAVTILIIIALHGTDFHLRRLQSD